MRLIIICFFVILAAGSFAHKGDFLTIENVTVHQQEGTTAFDFEVHNVQRKRLEDVKLELVINDSSWQEIYIPVVEAFYPVGYRFTVSGEKVNPETDKIQIEITELFGQKNDWGGWDNPVAEKQVNTLYSEFYADAPWRMTKYDELGGLRGIPVHFFLHDADIATVLEMKVDNINIQLKNASDVNFGPVLVYDTMALIDFQELFSCPSPFDADLDIKEFSLNSFTTSNAQTIDFNIDTDLVDHYVGVSEKYWYFTFTIPPSCLEGFNNVIDILVTIEYSNFTITDDQIGLRVFRSEEALPSQSGWYRGDTHLHSMYTQNSAEVGLPLCATKEACKLLGVDWVTSTDHTSDYDNYGASVQSNWFRIKSEAAALNTSDSTMIFIPALEVALNNSNDKLVHMLAYPNALQPSAMPFLGDANGDITPTTVTIDGAVDLIDSYNGFAYMAHPFSTGDELPTIPVDGGIWNLGSPSFPLNGSGFPLDGGAIICNDLNLASDVLSPDAGVLVKKAIKGGQIWNARNSVVATGDELDPWDVKGDGDAFGQLDTTGIEYHFRRFRQGQEIVNHINQLGLQMKNMDHSYENWKLYYAAGTDAHGSFNFSNTDDFANIGTITNNAVGKLSTVTYCPAGMGTSGEHVLTALKNGNASMSDGPLVTVGISTNGNDNTDELIMGEDEALDMFSLQNHYLNIDYSTSLEFGDVTHLTVIVGTEAGEFKRDLAITSTNGNNTLNYPLTDVLDTLLGVGNTPMDTYMYIRMELRTERDYTGMGSAYRTAYDVFHSISNPVWFRFTDVTELEEIKGSDIVVYPNPATQSIRVHSDVEILNLTVYDLAGTMLLDQPGTATENRLDISGLAKGVYQLRVETENNMAIRKFIKL